MVTIFEKGYEKLNAAASGSLFMFRHIPRSALNNSKKQQQNHYRNHVGPHTPNLSQRSQGEKNDCPWVRAKTIPQHRSQLNRNGSGFHPFLERNLPFQVHTKEPSLGTGFERPPPAGSLCLTLLCGFCLEKMNKLFHFLARVR